MLAEADLRRCPPTLDLAIPSLTYFLDGIAEAGVQVQRCNVASASDAPQRPIITEQVLLLPDQGIGLSDAQRYSLHLASAAHVAAHLLFSPARLPVGKLKPMGLAVISAIEDARSEQLLIREHPGLRQLFLRHSALPLSGPDLSFASLVSRLNLALLDDEYRDDNYWVNKGRDLFRARLDALDDYDSFRAIGSILANDLGQMRVRFNPQQYAVPQVYRDDNSYLWTFDQVSDQSVAEVRFQNPQPPSPPPLNEPDALAETAVTEELVVRYDYPEWDARLQMRRPDWCIVVEHRSVFVGVENQKQKNAVSRLMMSPSQHLDRKRRMRRQWEGEDIDLNAATEVLVDRRLGLAPDPRIFVRPGKAARRATILLLLDMSQSSNDYREDIGGTVLQLAKRAALMSLGAAAGTEDRVAVHGFFSNTREAVHYFRLLDPGQACNDLTLRRIETAEAKYSTRMGAAIRHATALLRKEETDVRAVVLISDGAPSDIDVFHADYLVEDAAVAVREALCEGIDAACVTLDPQAASYVRRIFGNGRFSIVDNAMRLGTVLRHIYARVSHGSI